VDVDSADLIQVDGIRKTYRGERTTVAIEDISLSLREREFLTLVGPSGCGKTTLLRAISGLLPIDDGVICHRGKVVKGIVPRLQIVFQEYNRSLFPWLSVAKNVRFPLNGISRTEADRRVREALAAVNLDGFDDHYPWQLSGGMQQRASIARAIAAQPELLLMDEPFASVDAQTRVLLELMLLELWERLGLSVLFVTHDIEEAIFVSDRILILSPRPSTIVTELRVDLPRPRDPITTKELPEFLELREQVFSLMGLRGDGSDLPAQSGGYPLPEVDFGSAR
jgi:NitT/TauT family transport system ATP-binding protein